MPRVIADGVNGLLVPAGDRAAFAQSIRRALAGADLRASLARAGRQTVVDRYSFSVRMQKVATMYDELLQRHPIGAVR